MSRVVARIDGGELFVGRLREPRDLDEPRGENRRRAAPLLRRADLDTGRDRRAST
jgi:hypothetical protein